MEKYDDSSIINVGTGIDISIKSLAEKIKKVVGYTGKIAWDKSKPDGTPRKLLNVKKLHTLGWRHKIYLDAGLKKTYAWYKETYE